MKVGGGIMVGRMREEMLVDGRLVRERREGEILSERWVINRGVRVVYVWEREWWDVDLERIGIDSDEEEDELEGEEMMVKLMLMRVYFGRRRERGERSYSVVV